MRKNENKVFVEGYVFDLDLREGINKNGNPYVSGNIRMAIDEDGIQVIPVNVYASPTYGSGKANPNYNLIKGLMDSGVCWANSGKDKAPKLSFSGGSLSINDYVSNQTGQLTSSKRIGGNFVNAITSFRNEVGKRANYEADMLITNVFRVDADEDAGIMVDYATVKGFLFDDFRQSFFPFDMIIENENGINYFEDLNPSPNSPVYTKIYGKIKVDVTGTPDIEQESGFGGTITIKGRSIKTTKYEIYDCIKVPYEFGEEGILTGDEVLALNKNRELMLAEIQSKAAPGGNGGFQPTPTATATPKTAPAQTVNTTLFSF